MKGPLNFHKLTRWLKNRIRAKKAEPEQVVPEPEAAPSERVPAGRVPESIRPVFDMHRGPVEPVERRRQYFVAPNVRNLKIISDLLASVPDNLADIYSTDTKRLLRTAIRAMLGVIESTGTTGSHHRASCEQRAGRMRTVHRSAVASLLDSNVSLEQQVRMLSWALDAPIRNSRGVSVIDVLEIDNIPWDGLTGESGDDDYPRRIFVWLAEGPVPKVLTYRAAAGEIVLVADAESGGLDPAPPCIRIDRNPVYIERGGGGGCTRRLRLSGAAGYAQALLSGYIRGAWVRINPPAGFCGLGRDIRLRELRELIRSGYLAAVACDGSRKKIAVARGSLPKWELKHRY